MLLNRADWQDTSIILHHSSLDLHPIHIGDAHSLDLHDDVTDPPRVFLARTRMLAQQAHECFVWMAPCLQGLSQCRDQVIRIYSQGFPKAHDVGKAYGKRIAPHVEFLNRLCLLETKEIMEVNPYLGWKTSLKPAHEPIVMARKAIGKSVLDNVLQYGTGALNIDRCRVPGEPLTYPSGGINRRTFNQSTPAKWDGTLTKGHADGRYPHNVIGEVEGHQKFSTVPNHQKRNGTWAVMICPADPL